MQVSISQSRCLSFQVIGEVRGSLITPHVSISQSRCLSFQVKGVTQALPNVVIRFNLAIEMLIISGCRHHLTGRLSPRFNLAIEMLIISGQETEAVFEGERHLFQSRNRDAYHFRQGCLRVSSTAQPSFNLAIEMLIISGVSPTSCLPSKPRFNLAIEMLIISGQGSACFPVLLHKGFNLAIEMLIISGERSHFEGAVISLFQSRNRDAYHFRVTITESSNLVNLPFQSRNRDAYHFRHMGETMTAESVDVSISQSRCLSFQAGGTCKP